MRFNWNKDEYKLLIEERGVSFQQVVTAIEEGDFRIVSPHPGKERYPNQVLFHVLPNDYIFVVPAVLGDEEYFLKTIYPSRKQTRAYLEGEWTHEK